MICLTVGNVTSNEARARMLGSGAELVELRLDLIDDPDLEELLSGDRPPVIVTNRPEREGGKFTGDEAGRLGTLRKAMKLGAEYVDIEWDCAEKLERTDNSKIIVSRHDLEGTPADITKWHEEMRPHGDVVKIVTTAADITDNFGIFDLLERSDVPTVSFCMGDAGAMSRILSPAYGGAWTYAAATKMDVTAPGQFSYDDMRELYRADSITRNTKIFGVLANPVGHSMSPLVHNNAFRESGIDAVYIPLLVTGDVTQFIREFSKRFPVGGFSVTIPHKEAAMEAVDEIDDFVRRAGVLNTIVVKEGKLYGYNTDIPAAMSAIESAFPEAGLDSFQGVKCLVLGTGGAGRAISLGASERGAMLTLTDGDAERAKRLAEELGAAAIPWEKRETADFDILINATPIGMYPNNGDSPISGEVLKKAKLVFDAVYNPPVTLLQQRARKAGLATASGLDMFVNQAAMQFESWTGQAAPTGIMRELILSRLENYEEKKGDR